MAEVDRGRGLSHLIKPAAFYAENIAPYEYQHRIGPLGEYLRGYVLNSQALALNPSFRTYMDRYITVQGCVQLRNFYADTGEAYSPALAAKFQYTLKSYIEMCRSNDLAGLTDIYIGRPQIRNIDDIVFGQYSSVEDSDIELSFQTLYLKDVKFVFGLRTDAQLQAMFDAL
jgi:hypothetical protein